MGVSECGGRTKEVNLMSVEKCREKGSRMFQKKDVECARKKKRQNTENRKAEYAGKEERDRCGGCR